MRTFTFLLLVFVFIACKKSGSDGNNNGTTANVTFTNNNLFPLRVIITGTGAADTLYPLPNRVLDFDVQPKSSVNKTNVPTGSRKMVVSTVCTSQQPFNEVCTAYVYRTVNYLPGQSYTEPLQ